MARKCSFWWMAVSSGLGVYFGITIFLLFTFYYKNDAAGAFGLVSGIFAAISLHLTLLNSDNRLVTWYSPINLKALSVLGLFCSLISLGLTIFYISYAYTYKIPMMPVKGSYYLVAVWSAMTCKWALTVSIISFRYARILQYTTPFLIVQEQD